jgi:ABC-type sugar transport system ATPase subunit
MSEPLVKVAGLCKAFGGVDVLRDAHLELLPGEIHALVGENGAGKSTLAKLIGGVHTPRAGTIHVNGQQVRFRNPHDAIAHGIALIHQEPLTFPDLSIAENIFIGRQPRRAGLLDWPSMHREAGAILGRLGVTLDPHATVGGLSIADQQMVEMAAALSQNAKVLLLDETTAALTPSEAQRLFGILRQLRGQGVAMAFIGHRLEEIFDIADRITVLRDGEIVGHRLTRETSVAEVLRLMVGRPIEALYEKPPPHPFGPVALEVRLPGVEFAVRAGEVVGLAGLVGAGRTEVVETIFGIRPGADGQIAVGGKPARIRNPRDAMQHGLALVPEDRQHHGVLLPQSVWRNATLAVSDRLARWGWRHDDAARALTTESVHRLSVRLRDIGQPIRELSGGNQQKIVLAKWLATKPRVMLFDEPTRGIDIGAKIEVHRLIAELAAQGVAVLLVSSDLPEILAMSDRVLVMRMSKIVAEFQRVDATAECVIAAATGQERHAA